MNLRNKDEFAWEVERVEIKIKRDEYEERVVRLVKHLIEIDQELFQLDSVSQGREANITREAA